ncbi:hypothetical protein [Cupriavidus oxalaticus]|uniref:Curculin (Mannose-binding) lectin protein n=1 Tax=Cupriavidus oxalaticus TaxID=96344 RepID=A0A976BFQ7_9BURK|nr:hypothetical protein [Cupriavidus oxalaticus]QRQ86247.1 hypothetical protein JTE91_23860 [Cupriavidus oxalaticus]QRQ95426.1 hypothetical protein JTE92_18400 [Cupriavidus oxalaticus]WQD84083.1 hypothetical protein U0036_06110 [Cupriavidus oxalaticus]SPC17397.1 conserved hypothetical protein [Cupriavidus oxalaticus]
MTITTADIKLMKSEVLLDTDNGGGRITSKEVVDGVSNNLFPDVSELDRVYGRISLRKAYPQIDVTGTDTYLGSHSIILKEPDDDNVSVTLFSTKSWTDVRTDAKDRVESYLARGVKWPGQLLETQLQGQRAIQILQKPSDALPKVGQTLVLIQDEGLSTEIEQYVRITKVESLVREFTASNGVKWNGLLVTCTIANPLLYDFLGPVASPYDDQNAKAKCRDTRVANAAVYYGIAKMVDDASIGDIRVMVNSIFSQLVPSAQSQTALADLNAAGNLAPILASGATGVDQARFLNITGSLPQKIYFGTGMVPGSFRCGAVAGLSDDGTGNLMLNAVAVGTVDYTTGTVVITASLGATGNSAWYFKPAAAPQRVSETASIDVDTTNRGNVYTITLNPAPKPRALKVSYMAQGNWYELEDQGGAGNQGVIRGSDGSVGSGTINYTTGTVVMTLGALPDVGSSVLFFWSPPSQYFNRVTSTVQAPRVQFQVATASDQKLIPSSVTITWDNGVAKSVTSDANGILSGDGTGYVRWQNGVYQVELVPTAIPAMGTVFTLAYQYSVKKTKSFSHPLRDGNGKLNLQLDDSNIVAGSLRVNWNVLINDYSVISGVPAAMQYIEIDPTVNTKDDGSGNLVLPVSTGTGNGDTVAAAAVNYSTGALSFNPDRTVSVPQPNYQSTLIGYQKGANGWPDRNDPVYRNTMTGITYYNAAALFPNDESGVVDVEYRVSGTPGNNTQTFTWNESKFDLTRDFAEPIVPGSVMFTWGGKTYFDRSGYLFTDLDPTTGSATQVGTVNYATGDCTITNWGAGVSNAISMQSLLTTINGDPTDYVVFRVPAAPVVPGSLQIRVVPLAGAPYSVTADANGTITSAGKCFGSIDYQTGVVRVRFGDMVTAAGNEAAIWYNAAAVQTDGKIFKPLPVFGDQILFNAVAYTYLPLDSTILGLDPVRLPQDGRVPIYRAGDVVVVHHTAKQAVTPSSGLVVDVGRVRVAAMRVIDSSNPPVVMSPGMYSTDLDAGTLTFNGTVSTSGMTGTIYVENRVEDMSLLSDVQITGQLTLMRQLSHVYPADETRVSSALIMGDLQARMALSFTQTSWASVFADAPSGGSPASTYNFTTYPLLLTDRSCIQERWAIVFTDTINFRVIGESVGQVALGNINTDCSPTNPTTGEPYFTLRALGWGGGWAAGNVLRFNSAAANYPLWLARTVLQSSPSGQSDSFRVQIRGDIDA